MLMLCAATMMTACNNSTEKEVPNTINSVDYTSVDIPDFVADSAYGFVAVAKSCNLAKNFIVLSVSPN